MKTSIAFPVGSKLGKSFCWFSGFCLFGLLGFVCGGLFGFWRYFGEILQGPNTYPLLGFRRPSFCIMPWMVFQTVSWLPAKVWPPRTRSPTKASNTSANFETHPPQFADLCLRKHHVVSNQIRRFNS